MLITKSPDGPNFRGGIQSGQIWSNEEKKGSSHTYAVCGMQKTRFGWNLNHFWTHQKNAIFGGSFWGTKICHTNKKGGRCTSRMSDKYKKLGLVGIQAAVLWDVLITNFRKKHKSRRVKRGQNWSNDENNGSLNIYRLWGIQKNRFGWNPENFRTDARTHARTDGRTERTNSIVPVENFFFGGDKNNGSWNIYGVQGIQKK